MEEKDESPAKKLKIETRETETKKMEIISEGKVKKAQNVQEKLAEIKSAYNENTKDDIDDHCGADKVRKVDEDVAIEKTEKEKEGKDDDEDEAEREEKQNASDSYCQVIWLTSPFLKSLLIHAVLLIRSFFFNFFYLLFVDQICKLNLRAGALPLHMEFAHKQKKQVPIFNEDRYFSLVQTYLITTFKPYTNHFEHRLSVKFARWCWQRAV